MTKDFADCAILSTLPSPSAVCKFWRTVFDVFIDADLLPTHVQIPRMRSPPRESLSAQTIVALHRTEAQATASHRWRRPSTDVQGLLGQCALATMASLGTLATLN